jgi:hypothetical protein
MGSSLPKEGKNSFYSVLFLKTLIGDTIIHEQIPLLLSFSLKHMAQSQSFLPQESKDCDRCPMRLVAPIEYSYGTKGGRHSPTPAALCSIRKHATKQLKDASPIHQTLILPMFNRLLL